MKPFRYSYSGPHPAAPFVLLNVFGTTDENTVKNLPALADTGADISVLPIAVLETVRAVRIGDIPIKGFDNRPSKLTLYSIRLQIRDLPVLEVEVVGSDTVTHAIVGRDVLNRYDIRLDGPNRAMTISDA